MAKKFDLSGCSVDTALETEGVWRDIGDGATLKIARLNNPKYTACFNRLIRPFRRQIQAGTLAESKQAELMAEALAETVLLDWKGVYAEDAELPYSKQEARRILADPQYSPFLAQVVELAQDEAAYRQMEVETELGERLPG